MYVTYRETPEVDPLRRLCRLFWDSSNLDALLARTRYGHASNGWTVLVCVRVHSRRPCCFVFAAGHWPHLRTPPGVLQDNSGTAIVGFTVILSNVSGKAAYTRTELRVGWPTRSVPSDAIAECTERKQLDGNADQESRPWKIRSSGMNKNRMRFYERPSGSVLGCALKARGIQSFEMITAAKL